MPKTSLKEWEALFRAADKDKSGALDLNELKAMLRSANSRITDSQIADTFVYFEGNNGDKRVTLAEFIKGMKKLEEFLNKLTALFHKFDKDSSGFLEKNEFKKVLEACGSKLTEAELAEILRKTDTSRDGKISLEEFLSAMM
ncbi:unnamed protein product [Lymnaea stagnalis]|uniref:EF-hand domain-containing protein n=1 Tax=Lymnaea stagnalis TaxID=6523 RepID=A0AAV2HB24_LYMST